jgi:hypothetical protein
MNSDVHSESIHGACLAADVRQVGPPLLPGTQMKRPYIEGWFGGVFRERLSREAERDEQNDDYESYQVYQVSVVDLAGYPARHYDDRNTVDRVRVFAVTLTAAVFLFIIPILEFLYEV